MRGVRDLPLLAQMDSEGSTAVQMVQYAALAVEAGMAKAVACVFSDTPLKGKGGGDTGGGTVGGTGGGQRGEVGFELCLLFLQVATLGHQVVVLRFQFRIFFHELARLVVQLFRRHERHDAVLHLQQFDAGEGVERALRRRHRRLSPALVALVLHAIIAAG